MENHQKSKKYKNHHLVAQSPNKPHPQQSAAPQGEERYSIYSSKFSAESEFSKIIQTLSATKVWNTMEMSPTTYRDETPQQHHNRESILESVLYTSDKNRPEKSALILETESDFKHRIQVTGQRAVTAGEKDELSDTDQSFVEKVKPFFEFGISEEGGGCLTSPKYAYALGLKLFEHLDIRKKGVLLEEDFGRILRLLKNFFGWLEGICRGVVVSGAGGGVGVVSGIDFRGLEAAKGLRDLGLGLKGFVSKTEFKTWMLVQISHLTPTQATEFLKTKEKQKTAQNHQNPKILKICRKSSNYSHTSGFLGETKPKKSPASNAVDTAAASENPKPEEDQKTNPGQIYSNNSFYELEYSTEQNPDKHRRESCKTGVSIKTFQFDICETESGKVDSYLDLNQYKTHSKKSAKSLLTLNGEVITPISCKRRDIKIFKNQGNEAKSGGVDEFNEVKSIKSEYLAGESVQMASGNQLEVGNQLETVMECKELTSTQAQTKTMTKTVSEVNQHGLVQGSRSATRKMTFSPISTINPKHAKNGKNDDCSPGMSSFNRDNPEAMKTQVLRCQGTRERGPGADTKFRTFEPPTPPMKPQRTGPGGDRSSGRSGGKNRGAVGKDGQQFLNDLYDDTTDNNTLFPSIFASGKDSEAACIVQNMRPRTEITPKQTTKQHLTQKTTKIDIQHTPPPANFKINLNHEATLKNSMGASSSHTKLETICSNKPAASSKNLNASEMLFSSFNAAEKDKIRLGKIKSRDLSSDISNLNNRLNNPFDTVSQNEEAKARIDDVFDDFNKISKTEDFDIFSRKQQTKKNIFKDKAVVEATEVGRGAKLKTVHGNQFMTYDVVNHEVKDFSVTVMGQEGVSGDDGGRDDALRASGVQESDIPDVSLDTATFKKEECRGEIGMIVGVNGDNYVSGETRQGIIDLSSPYPCLNGQKMANTFFTKNRDSYQLGAIQEITPVSDVKTQLNHLKQPAVASPNSSKMENALVKNIDVFVPDSAQIALLGSSIASEEDNNDQNRLDSPQEPETNFMATDPEKENFSSQNALHAHQDSQLLKESTFGLRSSHRDYKNADKIETSNNGHVLVHEYKDGSPGQPSLRKKTISFEYREGESYGDVRQLSSARKVSNGEEGNQQNLGSYGVMSSQQQADGGGLGGKEQFYSSLYDSSQFNRFQSSQKQNLGGVSYQASEAVGGGYGGQEYQIGGVSDACEIRKSKNEIFGVEDHSPEIAQNRRMEPKSSVKILIDDNAEYATPHQASPNVQNNVVVTPNPKNQKSQNRLNLTHEYTSPAYQYKRSVQGDLEQGNNGSEHHENNFLDFSMQNNSTAIPTPQHPPTASSRLQQSKCSFEVPSSLRSSRRLQSGSSRDYQKLNSALLAHKAKKLYGDENNEVIPITRESPCRVSPADYSEHPQNMKKSKNRDFAETDKNSISRRFKMHTGAAIEKSRCFLPPESISPPKKCYKVVDSTNPKIIRTRPLNMVAGLIESLKKSGYTGATPPYKRVFKSKAGSVEKLKKSINSRNQFMGENSSNYGSNRPQVVAGIISSVLNTSKELLSSRRGVKESSQFSSRKATLTSKNGYLSSDLKGKQASGTSWHQVKPLNPSNLAGYNENLNLSNIQKTSYVDGSKYSNKSNSTQNGLKGLQNVKINGLGAKKPQNFMQTTSSEQQFSSSRYVTGSSKQVLNTNTTTAYDTSKYSLAKSTLNTHGTGYNTHTSIEAAQRANGQINGRGKTVITPIKINTMPYASSSVGKISGVKGQGGRLQRMNISNIGTLTSSNVAVGASNMSNTLNLGNLGNTQKMGLGASLGNIGPHPVVGVTPVKRIHYPINIRTVSRESRVSKASLESSYRQITKNAPLRGSLLSHDVVGSKIVSSSLIASNGLLVSSRKAKNSKNGRISGLKQSKLIQGISGGYGAGRRSSSVKRIPIGLGSGQDRSMSRESYKKLNISKAINFQALNSNVSQYSRSKSPRVYNRHQKHPFKQVSGGTMPHHRVFRNLNPKGLNIKLSPEQIMRGAGVPVNALPKLNLSGIRRNVAQNGLKNSKIGSGAALSRQGNQTSRPVRQAPLALNTVRRVTPVSSRRNYNLNNSRIGYNFESSAESKNSQKVVKNLTISGLKLHQQQLGRPQASSRSNSSRLNHKDILNRKFKNSQKNIKKGGYEILNLNRAGSRASGNSSAAKRYPGGPYRPGMQSSAKRDKNGNLVHNVSFQPLNPAQSPRFMPSGATLAPGAAYSSITSTQRYGQDSHRNGAGRARNGVIGASGAVSARARALGLQMAPVVTTPTKKYTPSLMDHQTVKRAPINPCRTVSRGERKKQAQNGRNGQNYENGDFGGNARNNQINEGISMAGGPRVVNNPDGSRSSRRNGPKTRKGKISLSGVIPSKRLFTSSNLHPETDVVDLSSSNDGLSISKTQNIQNLQNDQIGQNGQKTHQKTPASIKKFIKSTIRRFNYMRQGYLRREDLTALIEEIFKFTGFAQRKCTQRDVIEFVEGISRFEACGNRPHSYQGFEVGSVEQFLWSKLKRFSEGSGTGRRNVLSSSLMRYR